MDFGLNIQTDSRTLRERYCLSKLCEGGNCEGCKNGETWCDDPRCTPYCRGCPVHSQIRTGGWIVMIIIVILIIFAIIIMFALFGPRLVRVNMTPVESSSYVYNPKNDQIYYSV